MRTLSLLRHAKSDWGNARLADFDRPLAPRGEAAAPRMGRHMHEFGLAPDLILCSPAVRTRETARLVIAEMKTTTPVIFDEVIYEATAGSLLARLRNVDAAVGHVLMIGHNPGLHNLALTLAGPSLPPEFGALRENLATGGLVVIELDIDDWKNIAAGRGRVIHFATPRGLHAQ